jgi:hypothetical protein
MSTGKQPRGKDMQTLYDQTKPAWDRIGRTCPNLALMARHFHARREMEKALRYGSGVIIKWISDDAKPARESEFRAEKWLAERASPAPVKQAAPASAALLLVACPSPDVAAKVQRVLAMLGCEVTEV